jgi:ABC-type uncharacterized transport system ATPase subunit
MSTTTKAGTHALSLSGVSRNFGGIRAVGDITFFVSHGNRLAARKTKIIFNIKKYLKIKK